MGGNITSYDREMIRTVHKLTDNTNNINLIASAALLFGFYNKYLYKGFKIESFEAKSNKQLNQSPISVEKSIHLTPNYSKNIKLNTNTKFISNQKDEINNNCLTNAPMNRSKSPNLIPDIKLTKDTKINK